MRRLKSLLAVTLPLLSLAGVLSPCLSANAQQAGGQAQQSQPSGPASNETVVAVTGHRTDVELIEKFAKILELKNRVVRVDGFDPMILNVTAIDPQRIRVSGLMQGVTNLVITDEVGTTMTIDVFVKGDARTLQAIIDRKFPNSSIEAFKVQEAVVLRGWVSHPEHITQIVEIAEQFYPKVLNQMRVGGVQQVMLKVRVMEAQRALIRELGMNFNYVSKSGFLNSSPGSITSLKDVQLPFGGTPVVPIADATVRNATASFGLVGNNSSFTNFMTALRDESLLKILAEPEVIATNGRPATLLSGGEFPILVPQSLGTLSVQFREFGVRLEAVATVLGSGNLRLELQPEVSERDFTSAVSVSGTTIPGLTVRRVNTQVEMKFGQTLMLAGLINNRQTATTHKLPFFGELPYVGAAFSRKTFSETESEVVITVTPELVAPLDEGQVPNGGPGQFTESPTDRELMAYGLIEVPKYGERCSNCAPGQSGPYIVPGLRENKQAPAAAAPVGGSTSGELILPPPSPPTDQSLRTKQSSTSIARRTTSPGVRQVGYDDDAVPTRAPAAEARRSTSSSTQRTATATGARGSQPRESASTSRSSSPPAASNGTTTKSNKGRPGLIEPSSK